MNTLPVGVRLGALISAIAWTTMFALGAVGQEQLTHYVGIAYHLALLPVVAGLVVAPRFAWARTAGYVWVLVDTLLDVAAINGLHADTLWALRLGAHISTAIWIAGASLELRRFPQIVGLLLAGSLAGHALVGPFVPEVVLAVTSFPLMLAWLIIIARGRPGPARQRGERLIAEARP